MPVQFDKFDSQKIELLKTHLDLMAKKEQPKHYEVFVDSLKAVPKTDDPSEFYGYEDYMNPSTNHIKVVIYASGNSPRNEQYYFSLKAQSQQEALEQGLNGLQAKFYTQKELIELKEERINKIAESEEIVKLKKELEEARKELKEQDDYIKTLEGGLNKAQENGNKIGGVHFGKILSVAAEEFIKSNPKFLQNIPILNGLSGLLDNSSEKNETETKQTDSEVSFKKKEQGTAPTTLSEQELEFIRVFAHLETCFTPEEITQVLIILEALGADKTKLETIVELLKS